MGGLAGRKTLAEEEIVVEWLLVLELAERDPGGEGGIDRRGERQGRGGVTGVGECCECSGGAGAEGERVRRAVELEEKLARGGVRGQGRGRQGVGGKAPVVAMGVRGLRGKNMSASSTGELFLPLLLSPAFSSFRLNL